MLTPDEELKLKAEKDALHFLTAFLLYERREETELRIAFHGLVQERHHNFHDKEGQDTEFTSCGNQVCINALTILQTARKARVEMNDFSIQLIAPYNLKVMRDTQTRVCIGYLENLGPIEQPNMILKVGDK